MRVQSYDYVAVFARKCVAGLSRVDIYRMDAWNSCHIVEATSGRFQGAIGYCGVEKLFDLFRTIKPEMRKAASSKLSQPPKVESADLAAITKIEVDRSPVKLHFATSTVFKGLYATV